jgi:hypothetical protein
MRGGGQPERVVELVLLRLGFCRKSDETTSMCSCGCVCVLDQGLMSLMACSQALSEVCEEGYGGQLSQESESEVGAELELSSDDWEDASDHTEADEAEAEVARDEE